MSPISSCNRTSFRLADPPPKPFGICRQAKTGPLVSYLQREYKDLESGAAGEDKVKATSDYIPFVAPAKSAQELRQQNLENLHVFLQNKALHAVCAAPLFRLICGQRNPC